MTMMMMSSTSPRNCFVQNDPNDDAKRTQRTIWRFVSSMSRDVRPFGRARGVLLPCRERERERNSAVFLENGRKISKEKEGEMPPIQSHAFGRKEEEEEEGDEGK